MSRSQARPEHPVLAAVGLPDAPVMTTRAARGTGIAFLELDFKKRNAGLTNPAHEDAFLIALQLDKADDFDLYADGRFVRPRGYAPGDIAIFDLRMNIATDLRDPFHAVNLYVPHRALLAMGDDGDVPRNIQELRHTVGTTVSDPVARGLLLSILNSSSITSRWRFRSTSPARMAMVRRCRAYGAAGLRRGRSGGPKS